MHINAMFGMGQHDVKFRGHQELCHFSFEVDVTKQDDGDSHLFGVIA